MLSLAAAGVAATVPGFLNLDLDLGTSLILRAGGALAIFVVVFFFNPAQLAVQSATSDSVPNNPLLWPVWDLFDQGLKEAFALAAVQAGQDGRTHLSTRNLFAAWNRLRPGSLPKLFSQLPDGALPDPAPAGATPQTAALTDTMTFSACVQDSVEHLSPKATTSDKLSSEDVFVDIAKNGTGTSVKRLRSHGVDGARIDQIVGQLGWSVVHR